MKKLILLLLTLSSTCLGGETRIKVAVLDTGITQKMSRSKYMCKDGVRKTVSDVSVYDDVGHGSHVIAIIAKKLDPTKHCIISIKVMKRFWRKRHEFWIYDLVAGLKLAEKLKVDYINMSLGGPEEDPAERIIIKRLRDKGVTITMAAGNDSRNLDKRCDYFPACYLLSGTHIVGNGTSLLRRSSMSNYGLVVTDWRDGNNVAAGIWVLSGTSQSSALLLSDLIYRSYRKRP